MPTPVSVARQCLTPQAAHALDEAVSVARRRSHVQTTSLHAVSALLYLPSSALRDACVRVHTSPYPFRLQFKALELSLNVALDRVPSNQLGESHPPPVSNSLMAAIKRSQASQRRQPENFNLHLSHHNSTSGVKVELQYLILSILDDPIVSRVFGEVGFQSADIKVAILRPLPRLLRSPRSRGRPLFLCSSGEASDRTPFRNHTRIGELLLGSKSPLLVGASAFAALKDFADSVERREHGVLPPELAGLNVLTIETDVLRFVSKNSCDKGYITMRFQELCHAVERSLGAGVLLNYGNLEQLVSDDASCDCVAHVIAHLTNMLGFRRRNVWLIGAVATHDTFMKFITRFPCVQNDWNLHLLQISSLPSSALETFPRSSLMESFVPFGGFFPTSSELKDMLACMSDSHSCDDKCEHPCGKERFRSSFLDSYWSILPYWLHIAQMNAKEVFDDLFNLL